MIFRVSLPLHPALETSSLSREGGELTIFSSNISLVPGHVRNILAVLQWIDAHVDRFDKKCGLGNDENCSYFSLAKNIWFAAS